MKKGIKKEKSILKKIWKEKESTPIVLFVLKLIGAFFLDLLRIIKNIILWTLLCLFGVGIVAAIVLWIKIGPTVINYSNFAKTAVEKSTKETFIPEQSTYIYDSKGNILAKLKGEKDATYIPYEDIPQDVIDAFVAVEDRSYWENPGIDVKGLIRVGIDFIKTKGEEMHGASTITQQLSRNIFLSHEVSIERKAKEMLIALNLTNKYSKEELMEYYINNICYSNAFYGIEAASIGYFNKSVSELTLSQICYLCAIPNAPEYYNPYKDAQRAVARRDKILGDMLEMNYITQEEYNTAIKEEIVIEKPVYPFNDYQTTYAIDCATKYLMELDGFEFKYEFDSRQDFKDYKSNYNIAYNAANNKLKTGGYKIYTTLDSSVQEEVQTILDENLSFNKETNELNGIYSLQGATTVIDNNTGKVIALVGGRSQKQSSYSLNRAYQSFRQPGSTFKPLVVYTPALMSGYRDTTTVYNISVAEAKKDETKVQQLTGTPMRLRNALEQSKNGVAWQVFDRLGADYTMSFVTKMKFSNISPDDYFNSSSLGGLTYGTTTVEMASAYATIENHGMYREVTCISKMYDMYGKDIYTEKEEIEIYSARAADTMTDMMTGVLTNGTARKLNWYSNTKTIAACKTGTTNDSKDGWLCGYTPYYTVAVWVGYDTPRELNNLYGATYPGQIWKDTMLSLIENKEEIVEFAKAEYPEEEIVLNPLLPEHAYETYMPGRDDEEILSDNYTVYDYRSDRVIGEQVTSIINQINVLDKSDPSFYEKLNSLYNEGKIIIDTIYSRKYTTEMTGKLDEAYNNKQL